LAREHERIEIQLLQVLRRALVECLRALLGKRETAVIGSVGVRWKVAASVSRTDLESWKSIQGSLEDQMRKRNRRGQRISNHVSQDTVALQPGLQLRNALRMDEDRHAQPLGFGPKLGEP